MKVSLDEIKQMFNDLIQEKKSREQIAFWASSRQSADDLDDLEFDPPEEQKRIWRSIIYLMGVDLKDTDGSYLHSLQNFIDFKNTMNLATQIKAQDFLVSESAKIIDEQWLFCPNCLDAWQSTSLDAAVVCTKCHNMFNNPRKLD